MNIVIRGPIYHPCGDGPRNGQYALQKILRQRIAEGLDWLRISHDPAEPGELPWYWCWDDKHELLRWDEQGRPWACGPNVLFEWSGNPGGAHGERQILDSPNCRLLFTESAWYEALIRKRLGPENAAPIVLWPYPIDVAGPDEPPALPPGPVFPAKWDLLIYAKSGPPGLAERLAHRFRRSVIVRYGQYKREGLLEAARSSRCCAYLSEDDRGPLALAEILLSGCPTIGIERGAPFIEHTKIGWRIPRLEPAAIAAAVEHLRLTDREHVRAIAQQQFDGQRIADTVIEALDAARREPR